MFHVRKPDPSLVEHVGSALAFTLVLATWIVAYVTVMPPDPVTHRTHVAEVKR